MDAAAAAMMIPMMASAFAGSARSSPALSMLITVVAMLASRYAGAFVAWVNKALEGAPKAEAKRTLDSRITIRNNGYTGSTISDNFIAVIARVLDDIETHNATVPAPKRVLFNIKDLYFIGGTLEFPVFCAPFDMPNGITVMTRYVVKTSVSNLGDTVESIILYVDLTLTGGAASALPISCIGAFIAQCFAEFEKKRKQQAIPHSVFEYKDAAGKRDAKPDAKPEYTRVPFDTTKDFSNLFFDDKADVLRRVDYFLGNAHEYRRLGIPHTLGFMLHGEPGTAKTSFIKALAKYTGRHVIILPTRNVRDVATLRAIFLDESVNGYCIPNHKRLYVFEDVDCGSWRSIVLSRALREAGGDAGAAPAAPAPFNAPWLHAAPAPPTGGGGGGDAEGGATFLLGPPPVTITLADLLELLDGVIEIPGRMIVMSSNHPEVLDPALLRPGRIDMVIPFRKLSRQSVNDMHNLWFGADLPAAVEAAVADRAFTMAELGAHFALHRDDLPRLHRALIAGAG